MSDMRRREFTALVAGGFKRCPAFGFRQPRSFRTTHANHVSGGPTRPWR
jgi:hypothetical protein